ncbi:two pore domain potassium channel family protein [Candidatus Jorgensenbacteria bacterium]|nr:two pore domain potassium channel family protein [Candidatus Jorgensenbacteria bacterium]
MLMITAVLVLAAGSWFYHNIEGWSWIDSLYFCVITLTTIGYGDFTPQTDVGKIFTIVYVFMGLGLIVSLIEVLSAHPIKHSVNKTSPNSLD